MAVPAASVKVELLKLKGVPAATPGAGNTRYARATLRAEPAPFVTTGRSRPIPDVAGDFDLAPEAAPWVYEARVQPGAEVIIKVELFEDRGDAAPVSSLFVQERIVDPWASGVRTLGSGPAVEVRVTTAIVGPTDPAFLARAAAAAGVSGTLTVAQGFLVEITSLDGLYQPDPAATTGTPGSKKVAGYLSADNLGRIFTNRKPDGTWARDTQFIDVGVKVTALGGATIPAGAKVEWTVVDLDDPTNDARDFHREWGRYVDPNDYDAAGRPIGAHAGDNAAAHSPGNANEDLLFGATAQGTSRWAKTAAGPSPTPSSRIRAETPITLANPRSGSSSVRVHCPNVLGTNFVLRCGLTGTPPARPVFAASTGVMTIWSLINVEVVRMAGAHSLTGALVDIPRFFLPVCVQLDFRPERSVTGPLDKPRMAAADSLLTGSTRAWVDNSNVFKKRGQGGWFFLGGARLPIPAPGASPPALFTGTSYAFGTTGTDVWIEVTGSFATADYVDVTWTDSAGNSQNTGFAVDETRTIVSGGTTRMFLWGNDVTPSFTGHDADGSIAHAYATSIMFYPRHTLRAGAAALAPGGFGIPAAGATLEVFPPGAVFTTGISPPVKNPLTGTGSFFAGRTVLFTHTPKFSTGSPPARRPDFDARVLSTVVHEFLHAFGMPHKCGHWDWRTPRIKSCCMNYFDTWLINAGGDLIPGTVRKQGNDMCGRHLMEVRRVRLERNLGLNW
jgi:hypothetical protein